MCIVGILNIRKLLALKLINLRSLGTQQPTIKMFTFPKCKV